MVTFFVQSPPHPLFHPSLFPSVTFVSLVFLDISTYAAAYVTECLCRSGRSLVCFLSPAPCGTLSTQNRTCCITSPGHTVTLRTAVCEHRVKGTLTDSVISRVRVLARTCWSYTVRLTPITAKCSKTARLFTGFWRFKHDSA